MYDLIQAIQSVFDSDFGGVIIGVLVLVVAVNAIKKSRTQKKPAADGESTTLRKGVPTLPDQKPPRRTPAPAQVRRPQAQPVQMRMDLPPTPARSPQAAPASGSLAYASTEGVELHAPGFHGTASPRLEKVDLGAQRARENAHTAANADWKLPNETRLVTQTVQPQAHPRYTAAQLREAFIMKEILDAPVSRRQGMRRNYGR